jgi:hypothetical protein
VKRTSKKPRAGAARSPKLPDELHPIVDSVVEVVFERLRAAAMPTGAKKSSATRRPPAKIDLPLPKQREALAEALADLLLADLASRARAKGKAKAKARGAGSRASKSTIRKMTTRKGPTRTAPKPRAKKAKVRTRRK